MYTRTKEKNLYCRSTATFTVKSLTIHIQAGHRFTGLLKLAKNHLQLKGKKNNLPDSH